MGASEESAYHWNTDFKAEKSDVAKTLKVSLTKNEEKKIRSKLIISPQKLLKGTVIKYLAVAKEKT